MPYLAGMIIVACKSDVERVVADHPDARVVSLVERAADAPECACVADDRRLIVDLADICGSANESPCAAAAQKLVAFVQDWSPDAGPLVLHCEQGVSRSTAAAFIVLCAKEPFADECDLARRLREAAPHADPNLTLVHLGDAVLGREGRMLNAVLDLPDDPPPPTGGPARIPVAQSAA